jgi:hypothetical protein
MTKPWLTGIEDQLSARITSPSETPRAQTLKDDNFPELFAKNGEFQHTVFGNPDIIALFAKIRYKMNSKMCVNSGLWTADLFKTGL